MVVRFYSDTNLRLMLDGLVVLGLHADAEVDWDQSTIHLPDEVADLRRPEIEDLILSLGGEKE